MRQLLLASVGLACAACTANANLLTNGNLDLTYAQEIVPDFFLPKPIAWQNIGSRAISGPYEDEMSSEPWAGPAPTPVTTDGLMNPPFPAGYGGPDGGVFFKAFSGNLANGPATGHLQQDVAGTPGLTYTLSGWVGAEANLLVADAQIAVEFLNGGGTEIPGSGTELSLLPTLFVDNGQSFDYKQYFVTATAPAGTTMVRARFSMIGGQPNPAGGGQALVIDDFALVVPEPSGIALAAIGAAALLRRMRRH